MLVSTYADAEQFLEKTQRYLEQEEIANGLMLGICFNLKQTTPQHAPLLAAVEDKHGMALVAVMTPPHKLVLYSHLDDPAEAVHALIEQMQDAGWTIPCVLGQANVAETFARLWGAPYRPGVSQRVYELRGVIHPAYPPGTFRAAEPDDLDRIARWVQAFQFDIGGNATLEEAYEAAQARIEKHMITLWEHEEPVSMAAKARPMPNGIAVNLVYTPPAARRKGYATACVARLSQLLLDEGYRWCTLFTDLANPTSNSIYQQIGYVPVCDFNEYHFLGNPDVT